MKICLFSLQNAPIYMKIANFSRDQQSIITILYNGPFTFLCFLPNYTILDNTMLSKSNLQFEGWFGMIWMTVKICLAWNIACIKKIHTVITYLQHLRWSILSNSIYNIYNNNNTIFPYFNGRCLNLLVLTTFLKWHFLWDCKFCCITRSFFRARRSIHSAK